MSEQVYYLTVDHVLAIHQRTILEFGGTAELRDRGLLESAVAMPSAGFGGKELHVGLAAKAAAYLFHLCKNHPFVDGNKRTALATAEAFLYLNGVDLSATDREVEELTIGVADGTLGKEDVIRFFKSQGIG